LPPGIQLDGRRVRFDRHTLEFPALGHWTSSGANSTTLALTSRLTHSILLLALA
jgi:hypothetical protein